MNEAMQAALNWAKDNQALLIKIGATVVGATVGLTVATVVINAQETALVEFLIDEAEENSAE